MLTHLYCYRPQTRCGPFQIRDEDVFKGLDNMVKNFLVSVPLVADLRSPAMRERHWQQLMEATKARSHSHCVPSTWLQYAAKVHAACFTKHP